MSQTLVSISDISIANRHRTELGDIGALCASIEDLGLLQPVVLDGDGKLIAGFRRMQAYKKLGRNVIPAVIARSVIDAYSYLRAERDENICRKDFTPVEVVALGHDLENWERREAEQRRRDGQKSDGRGRMKNSSESFAQVYGRTVDRVGASFGMSGRQYEKAKAVVEAAESRPEKFEHLLVEMNRTGRVHGAFRKLKIARQAETIDSEPPPLPTGPFRVIVVDPPWQYDKRAGDPSQRGAISYPSMDVGAIKALAVGQLARADAVLWLWTTNAHLPVAFEIAAAWGFAYKTLLTWVKDRMGMGDWLRGKTEHFLMCVRGKPTVNLTNQTTVLRGPLRKHSQKPEEFYELVEKLCPGSKVELFARQTRDGWSQHGDEALQNA